jgi:hypothetical protein
VEVHRGELPLEVQGSGQVAFDWMADGLWEIPFPGSVTMGPSLSPEYFGMPGRLAVRIRAWQANLDSREPVGDLVEEEFDYDASDAEALDIANEVKLFLGEDHYVEFHPFREIVVRDGAAVELEVPRFITDIAR